MAYNYLWTWRWYFAAQYLLISPRSVGVFSFYSLKIRVNFIVKNWASSNASGGYLPLLFGNLKSLIDPLKTRLKKKTGNCCSNGGFVASNHPATKLALRYGSCPQTFSNAISPIQACVVLEALNIVGSEEGQRRRVQMLDNAIRLRHELGTSGFEVMGEASPIIPVVIGDSGRSRVITTFCLERGALVNLVEYPAVSKNAARFRLQAMSDHTEKHILRFVGILKQAAIDADKMLASI